MTWRPSSSQRGSRRPRRVTTTSGPSSSSRTTTTSWLWRRTTTVCLWPPAQWGWTGIATPGRRLGGTLPCWVRSGIPTWPGGTSRWGHRPGRSLTGWPHRRTRSALLHRRIPPMSLITVLKVASDRGTGVSWKVVWKYQVNVLVFQFIFTKSKNTLMGCLWPLCISQTLQRPKSQWRLEPISPTWATPSCPSWAKRPLCNCRQFVNFQGNLDHY